MTDSTTQILQAVSAGAAFMASGQTFCASYLTVPPLYLLDASFSAPFFKDFFWRGAATLPVFSLMSAATNFTLSYWEKTPEARNAYAIAGTSALAIMPWTMIVLQPTNSTLLSLTASPAKSLSQYEVVRLLKSWTAKNYGRSVLGAVSGLMTFYAMSINK